MDLEERKGHKEFKVCQDRRDKWVFKDYRVLKVPKDKKEIKEFKVLPVLEG